MDFIQAIILGVVEGVTEFLPISSTGHLILTSDFLKIPSTEFVKTFEIFIQSGAILAVVVLYWKTLLNISLLKRILVAFIPTAIVGLTLYKFIKQYLLASPDVVVASLLIGGVALIGVELLFKNKLKKSDEKSYVEEISYEKALAVGVFQSMSVVPGVSRAAASIVGGMLIGLNRKTAVEFSFFLAIPTILAATLLDASETNILSFSPNEHMILATGFIVSFITALGVIKWLIGYVQTNTFIPFGIYRIALAILYFFLVIK